MAKFVQIIAWNSKRHYTAAGQRIAAGYTEDRVIYMVDIDRSIGYKFAEPFGGLLNDFVPALVMRLYDGSSEKRDLCIGDDEWKTLAHCARQVETL